jgi:hypothetical protein
MDYSEILDRLLNFDRGFYAPIELPLQLENNAGFDVWWLNDSIHSFGLIHIRVGLDAFSSAMGGTSIDLTSNALKALSDGFSLIREEGGMALIRFTYDIKGITYSNSDHTSEPSIELIERHIQQLGEVLYPFRDVIAGIETGMLGPWGEQHTSSMANDPHNFYRVIEKWSSAFPGERTLSFRRPLQILYWYNEKYNKNVDINEIDTLSADEFFLGENFVGQFNDGYLASADDFGTYLNREKELLFLSKITAQSLFGGEVETSQEGGGVIGEHNSVSYLSQEAFKTHTSYLNIRYNDKVIDAWNNTIYEGEDESYKGRSGLTYIENHLGYRFVIRESKNSKIVSENGGLSISCKIENVGFGNVVNAKNMYLILESAKKEMTYLKLDYNIRNIKSRTTQTIEVDFPFESLKLSTKGEYNIYMKIIGKEDNEMTLKRTIRFANRGVYDEEVGGNYLGGFIYS